MKRIVSALLAVLLLLSLAACGGGMSQKDMADVVVKAAMEDLKDKGTVYSEDFLIFTPSADKKSTYVMMGFYYGENGTAVEDTALGVFTGDSMSDFAVKGVDHDKYFDLLEAMPVNNTEKFAKQSLIDEVCKNNGVATKDQAKTDLEFEK